MTLENKRIQAILRLLIFVIKTGQLKNLLRMAIWAIKSRASWNEWQDRVSGVYYEEQVREAAERWRAKHDEGCTIRINGYEKWKRDNMGKI